MLNNQNTQAPPNENLEQKAERAADELQIRLPGSGLPPILRFIVLFMLAGGISIIGSVFADTVNPTQISLGFYLLRIIVGSLIIATAYGLLKLKRWALWIYGVAIFIGIAINPVVTIFPLVILIYLIYEKEKFAPSIFDFWAEKLILELKEFLQKYKPR